MQLTVGTLMLYISFNVQRLMDDVRTSIVDTQLPTKRVALHQASHYVHELTFVFTSLVFISATQGVQAASITSCPFLRFSSDIAVDGGTHC